METATVKEKAAPSDDAVLPLEFPGKEIIMKMEVFKPKGKIAKMQAGLKSLWNRYSRELRIAAFLNFLLGYFVYLGFAIAHNYDESVVLIVLTCIVVVGGCYVFVKKHYGSRINDNLWCPLDDWMSDKWMGIRWLLLPALVMGLCLYLALNVVKSARQLQSLLGVIVFLGIPLLTCKDPDYIRWRPVIWGLAVQLVMGIVVLRWKPGYDAIKFIAAEVNRYMNYSMAGAASVFGDPFFFLHPFAMLVVPLVVFVGATTHLMYYYGLTEFLINKIGWLMQRTLQTTAVESVSIGGNVFLSVVDIMLMLRHYIPMLTRSEFHAFLVGSHSSIAGFAFTLFTWFGTNPQHLLTSAVMSAPAAVAISKLNVPETQESKFKEFKDIKLAKPQEVNGVEAFANGAWQAGKSVAALLVQVIAAMSFYAFVNAAVAWVFGKVGLFVNLEIIFSYIFRPVAFLIGVEWEDTERVASILGIKIMAHEMLAFMELGKVRSAELISERSASICTYALCGFSSLGSLAMLVGLWTTLNKTKASEYSAQIPRLLVNTNLACFMTACIAGLLYDDGVVASLDPDGNTGIGLVGWFLQIMPSYRDILKYL